MWCVSSNSSLLHFWYLLVVKIAASPFRWYPWAQSLLLPWTKSCVTWCKLLKIWWIQSVSSSGKMIIIRTPYLKEPSWRWIMSTHVYCLPFRKSSMLATTLAIWHYWWTPYCGTRCGVLSEYSNEQGQVTVDLTDLTFSCSAFKWLWSEALLPSSPGALASFDFSVL